MDTSLKHTAAGLCGEVGVTSFILSAVGEALLRVIPARFPGRPCSISREANPVLVFPCENPELSALCIHDDVGEATIEVGDITHGHFDFFEDGVSDEEKAEIIAADVANFLARVFRDEVEFSRTFTGGGWGPRGSRAGEVHVWSGRV